MKSRVISSPSLCQSRCRCVSGQGYCQPGSTYPRNQHTAQHTSIICLLPTQQHAILHFRPHGHIMVMILSHHFFGLPRRPSSWCCTLSATTTKSLLNGRVTIYVIQLIVGRRWALTKAFTTCMQASPNSWIHSHGKHATKCIIVAEPTANPTKQSCH